MLKHVTVPKEWAAVLKDIHKAGYPEAIIHGGALRDLVLGKTHRVKDLDIALQGYLYTFVSFEGVGLPYFKYPLSWHGLVTSKEYYGDIPDLHNLETLRSHHTKIPVQIAHFGIAKEWFGRKIINRNDFGINQIGWDGKRFIHTRAFEHDVKTKTFTALKFQVRKQAENSIKRANNWKYSGDYQGFTFDVSRAREFLDKNPDVTVTYFDTELDDLLG